MKKMPNLVGWSDLSYLYFSEFWVKKFETFWSFQISFWWPKKPEIVQNLSIFGFPFWRDQWKICFFCPKRVHICQIGQIEKRAWDSVTRRVWVYPEKFNFDFWPQIFFLTSQHVWGPPQMIWEKNPMLNFSGWPPKLRSPFNWDSQKESKMRRIVKFRLQGTPYGKSGHGTL